MHGSLDSSLTYSVRAVRATQVQLNARCSDAPGSFACECDPGFELSESALSCTDVNECIAGTHSCIVPAPHVIEASWTHWFQFHHENMVGNQGTAADIVVGGGKFDLPQLHFVTGDPQLCPGGGCIHFDHSVSSNPLDVALVSFAPTDGITISFHLRISAYYGSEAASILCATENDFCISLYQWRIYIHPFGVIVDEVQDVIRELDEWVHLVLVLTRDGQALLYHNGEARASSLRVVWDSSRFESPNNLRIGASLYGDLADLRIYDRALASHEVWRTTTYKVVQAPFPLHACLFFAGVTVKVAES